MNLEKNKHENDYLQKSWNKYGEDSFIFYVLEYCDIDMLDEREKYYIEKYNTLDRNLGYNLKFGGQNGGSKYSKEIRDKMSDSVKKSYNESLRKIRSESALNQWSNPKIKEKISGENNGMYGKKHTEETRKKISKINKGRISQRRNLTPVFCVETGIKYKDATEAGNLLKIRSSNILNVCRGERKTCGGYHWKFIENLSKEIC